MLIKNIIFTAISLSLLSGCASKNRIDQVTSPDGSTVAVAPIFTPPDMNNNHYADVYLREVTPFHSGTGAGIAALTAVLSGQISTEGFDKQGYKGNSIKTMPEPSKGYLLPKAEKLIEGWLTKNGQGP